jgi:Plasmid stabilisation system protein.
MYTLEIKEEADADIAESYIWYETQKPSLGDTFLEEVDEYFEVLIKNPEAFQIKNRKNNRLAPLKKFPFVIVYRIEQSSIVVFAVYHTSRNPKKWKKRH